MSQTAGRRLCLLLATFPAAEHLKTVASAQWSVASKTKACIDALGLTDHWPLTTDFGGIHGRKNCKKRGRVEAEAYAGAVPRDSRGRNRACLHRQVLEDQG